MTYGIKHSLTRNQPLLLRTACACGGLVVTGRLVYVGWKSGDLFGRTASVPVHRSDEVLVWMAYLSLAIALAIILYKSRKTLPPNWVVGAFSVSLLAEILSNMAESDSFGNVSPVVISVLKIISALAAALTALGLPIYFHGLQRLAGYAAERGLSEARLAAATESSLNAIVMLASVRDSEGTICDFNFSLVNRNAELMLGSGREHLLGKRLGVLFPVLREAGRIAQYEAVVETGKPFTLETYSPILHKQGKPVFCRIQVVKLDDGVAVNVTDITPIKAAEQELRRTLAFNKAIVCSSPFSIIVTDLAGRITAANPAAERMLWYSEEELCGADITLLHDQQEIARRARALSQELMKPIAPNREIFRAKADLGLTDESEWTYIRKDGSRVPVQLTTSVVEDETGEAIGIMGISYDLTERKQSDEYIYHLAHHDPLTGLPSRTLLRDRLEVAVERGKRFQSLFAVLMIDLDHFKRINDSLGHQVGDNVLREVAIRLRGGLRKLDTIARFGGDEFVVLLTELRSRSHAETVARKIMATLSMPIRMGSHDITVTASIGLSMYPDSPEPDDLIKHADIALCRSKAMGRNDLAIFTPGLGQKLMDRLRMESALRTALERQEFFLVYQPQISLRTFELTGVEALIRWKNPTLGLVMPNDFIPLAEEIGLIVPIGAWALRTACEQIAQLQRDLHRTLIVAVNLSPRQVQQKNFQSTLEGALADSGLSPSCLEVEITEHLLMRDSEECLDILERIQALGVTVAIDDFGTGFSNMSYITRFKIDRLKIDRSFIARCVADPNSLAVTTAIVALAHSLKMEVVAEGVETQDQLETLCGLRCDSAQGFLYARPLALADLHTFAGKPGFSLPHPGLSSSPRHYPLPN